MSLNYSNFPIAALSFRRGLGEVQYSCIRKTTSLIVEKQQFIMWLSKTSPPRFRFHFSGAGPPFFNNKVANPVSFIDLIFVQDVT
jgi:hypothetical protein